VTVSRPLPGIRFETVAPAPDQALPRMDIAVFAGFALTGPLHVPVAIESVAQFAAVFGDDAPLAWDTQRQQRVYACLGPAVRAFFSNGGRRCWVIRIARSEALEALRSTYGVQAVVPDGIARYNRFPLSGVLAAAPQADGGWTIDAAYARARCEGSWSDALRVATALTAEDIAVENFTTAPQWNFVTPDELVCGDLLRFDGPSGLQAFAAVATVSVQSASLISTSYSVALGPPSFFRAPTAASKTLRGTAGFADGSSVAARLTPAPGAAAKLKLLAGVAQLPPSGSWIAFDDDSNRYWFSIGDTVAVERASSSSKLVATFAGSVWCLLTTAPALPSQGFAAATALKLVLSAGTGEGDSAVLDELGLASAHPQYWNAQPTDEAFYSGDAPTPGVRFPLAGDGGDTAVLLPLAVGAAYGPEMAALPQAASALERDGLSRFGADLFIDPYFESTGINALIDQADFLRYLSPMPRRLFGIHAALGFQDSPIADEATLIAVPDAMHRGWDPAAATVPAVQASRRFARPEWLGHRGPCVSAGADASPPKQPDWSRFLDCDLVVLHAPHFFDAPAAPTMAGYTLRWTLINPRPDTFVLEEARLADWSDAREIYRGANASFDVVGRERGCYFYRVRALLGDTTSDWSKGLAVDLLTGDWTLRTPDRYAGAVDGEGQLLAVHRTLLRLCAAKGELFAVLAMPSHYREAEALAYVQQLCAATLSATSVPVIGAGEAVALSYAALYHPWLTETRDDGGALDTPPDGPATGVLAVRALQRGAWIAPANEPMKDVVALTPVLRPEWRQAFQDAHINLLRQEARGFLVLCADTLSDDEELRPINVRRLLILLRRLALRRGANYVFEPNGGVLRRMVSRAFESTMNDLFKRGAFAGRTPEQSYQVRIGDDLNTPQSVDAGRLIVELKVAPALPMSFLTVRLQQIGERLTVAEIV
jgi:hypothetical protein